MSEICATVKWYDPREGSVPEGIRALGLFEVEPTFFAAPVVVFMLKEGKYYGCDGSLLSPEYKLLLRWYPIPQESCLEEIKNNSGEGE